MLRFLATTSLLFSFTCCGNPSSPLSTQSDVTYFKSTTPKRPVKDVVYEIVEYNQLLGTLTVTHTQTGANATMLDTNSMALDDSKRELLDVTLKSMKVESYKEDYTWNGFSTDFGASASDGPYMDILFITNANTKSIHIDTVDSSILPKPLSALYEQLLNLNF